MIEGRLRARAPAVRNGWPGIARHCGVEVKRNTIREAQLAPARRVNHLHLHRHVAAGNGAHHGAGAIEVSERELIGSFRGEHVT